MLWRNKKIWLLYMKFTSKEVILKDGRRCILRSACEKDAKNLLEYLKITAEETHFLTREPEEITMTLEQEKEFIQKREDAPRELLLIAEMDGRHVGNCSIMQVGSFMRYAHRCSLGIALYQEFCGLGIGRIMMEEVLKAARECGYEQVELEVVADNVVAVELYQKLGFEIYGTYEHNMKYKDGSYADVYLMKKEL